MSRKKGKQQPWCGGFAPPSGDGFMPSVKGGAKQYRRHALAG
ncbi:MAG: hypothetical protein ABSG54_08825 [Terriglobia bacterium]